jgi:hypothetical protein
VNGISDAQRSALGELASIIEPATYLAGGVAVAHPTTLSSALEQTGIRILTRSEGTLYLEVSGVPASILRYRYPLLEPATHLPGIPVPVASIADLACMKLSAIAGRGARRDFWDLHTLMVQGQSLRQILDAYVQKYAAEDVGHVVRSLVYFTDAEAEPMPSTLTKQHWAKIKADLTAWVRAL